MNFLAHQYLSGNNDNLKIGNFIADFVKGKKYKNYEEEIQDGILLHREIDWFTDNHSIVRNLNSSLRDSFGKYSGVAVDIYFDHFLSKNWNDYSKTDLSVFCNNTYALMSDNKTIMPTRALRMLKYMKRDNWLYNYQFINGVDRALKGLASRTKFYSGLEKGASVLESNYQEIHQAFRIFIEEIRKHVGDITSDTTSSDG